MRAGFPIIGLLRGHGQKFADEREVEVQQEGSVKKQEVFAAALGIAGEFAFADGKICVAADRNCGLRIADCEFNGRAVLAHDELVGDADVVERAVGGDSQNQRVVEATGALHHGAPAGTAS